MEIINKDLLIIGAGPSGLFAIFEAGMLKISSVVIDSLDFIGGQCTALYPQKPIYDIPAYPSIDAADLIYKLKEQADPFNPLYLLGHQAIGLKKNEDKSFSITTSKNVQINCKCIIIAAGSGSFGPNRPPIANIEKFEGKSVFYLVNDTSIYNDKIVVIAGGGDSAVDWAVELSKLAKKIYVVHRRDKFRAAPESYDKMMQIASSGKIEMVIPYQLEGLEGENGQIKSVIVKDLDNNIKNLEADYLLPFFGLSMDLGPITSWGLQLNKSHIEVTQKNMSTNIDGIYAIGDVATYEGKLKLILTSFAEAASACHDMYKYIFPDQALHFEYSTSKGIKN